MSLKIADPIDLALSQLGQFEAWVVKRRFRIGEPISEQNSKPRSYRDLERECGLAPFRLKQIEKEAIAKMETIKAEAKNRETSWTRYL